MPALKTKNPCRVKFFSVLEFAEGKKFEAGDKVNIQIMRTGEWNHQIYGNFRIKEEDLKEVKSNFDKNVLGRDLYVDENHEPDHKALAWFKEIYFTGKNRLDATFELTKKGADLLTEGLYRYFSPEIYFEYNCPETGETIYNLLVGGAFTNNPFFKGMKPLMASEVADLQTKSDDKPSFSLFFTFNNFQMDEFLKKVAQFAEKSELNANMEALLKEFSALPEGDEKAQLQMELKNSFGFKFSDEETSEETKEETTTETKEETKEETTEDAGADSEEETKEETADTEEEKADEGKEEEKATEQTETLKASEVADLREKAAKFAEMQRAQAFAEMKGKVEGFVFKEGNTNGRIPAKFSEKLTKIALSLNEQKRGWLFEVLGEVKAYSELTKELGSSEKGEKLTSENALSKFNELVEKKMKEGLTAYNAQTAVYRENPEFVSLLG